MTMKKTTWITHDGKEWESEDAAKRWELYRETRRPDWHPTFIERQQCNDYLRRTGQCEPNLWAPESAAAVSPSAPKCIEGDIGTRAHYEELQRNWRHKHVFSEPVCPPKLDLHQQIDLLRSQLSQALCERYKLRQERNDLRTERDKLRTLLSDVAHAMAPLLRRIGEL